MFDYNAVSSAGGRLGVWQAAWNIFIEHPFIGSGTGTFAYQAQKYGIINTLDAHNFILDILSNSGILGFILYSLPFALIAFKMWKRIGFICRKNESFKETEISGYAVDAAVIFAIISAHFNSLFSPHLTFPVTSLPLYALCAIYSAAPPAGTFAAKDKNGKKAKNVENAIISFEMHFQYNKFIFIALLAISFVMLPQCFKLYSADVSNFKGVDVVAATGNFSRATALFEDASSKWGGAAYLLNNSICVLLEELTKPLESRKSEPFARAKMLAETAGKYSPYNILIKNIISIIDKTAVEVKNQSLNRPSVEREKILAAPQGALNGFAMAYGKNAYKEFSGFNEKLIKEILEKMNTGASADIMSNYSSYLGDSLNYAVNFGIAGIEDGLAEYIKKTARETQQAVKYLPLVDYDYKIRSGLYSQEKLVVTTGAYILPMIWKFGRGLERSAVKANLDKILENTSFSDMKLMPVIDCFVYARDSAENEFQNYGHHYNRYWKLVKSFSDGKFEEIIKDGDFLKTVNDNILEKMGIRKQNGYILLSWAHYKMKNYDEAKQLIYQSLAMNLDSNYEFTYKAGLLFDGAIEEFYRPSLYSYYDQSVMMALIRAHKGDYKKILPEIFDYLNAVIFN